MYVVQYYIDNLQYCFVQRNVCSSCHVLQASLNVVLSKHLYQGYVWQTYLPLPVKHCEICA